MRKIIAISALFLALVFSGCNSGTPADPNVSIVPKPQSLTVKPGSFKIKNGTPVVYCSNDLQADAGYLAGSFKQLTGLELPVRTQESANAIILKLNEQIETPEGYTLKSDDQRVVIEAKTSDGIFYGIQSLLQLLPSQVKGPVRIPAVEIVDQPRYSWRGLHLDVCRHFFPVEFVEKLIDGMAMHKMNTFHWHLTDDQGWRIEIKKYPKLTEIGAWRPETKVGHMSDYPHKYDGQKYGGFYTQEQIREVVKYAQERHITIVPEIEMPGHAQAAVAAYPELSCFADSTLKPWTLWGVSENVFCAGKEETFRFIEDVLTEVCDLFPGGYVHVGGDECPKSHWQKCPLCQKRIKAEKLKNEHELQSYFIQRVEHLLAARGKKLIGWDEILEGGLAENAAVMSWRGEEGGIEAASMGHNVVMTPGNWCYFDNYQSNYDNEPVAIGGLTPMEEVYGYEPTPAKLPDDKKELVMGAQANVWTEYMASEDHVEYMIFPRLSALSEVLWTNPEHKDYSDFTERMNKHYLRLAKAGLNFRVPVPEEMPGIQIFGQEDVEIALSCEASTAQIRYTTDGSEPGPGSPLYSAPIKVNLKNDITLKAATFLRDGTRSKTQTSLLKFRNFVPTDKPSLEPGLKYTVFTGPFRSFTEVGGTEKSTGTTLSVRIPEAARDTMSGWKLEGYLKIEKEGTYQFELTSACGSGMFIGDELVINNDGFSYGNTRTGNVFLKPGLYPVRINYFDTMYGCWLELKYKGPGIELTPVPEDKLFQ